MHRIIPVASSCAFLKIDKEHIYPVNLAHENHFLVFTGLKEELLPGLPLTHIDCTTTLGRNGLTGAWTWGWGLLTWTTCVASCLGSSLLLYSPYQLSNCLEQCGDICHGLVLCRNNGRTWNKLEMCSDHGGNQNLGPWRMEWEWKAAWLLGSMAAPPGLSILCKC